MSENNKNINSNVIYLHGYISSPNSLKAKQTERYLAQNFPDTNYYCPQLPASPLQSIKLLTRLIDSQPSARWLLIGSSLGGYYANYLSEKFSTLSVLINPAVRPYELFADFSGEQKNDYTGEVFTIDDAFMHELRLFNSEKLTKKNYMVMVQTGDEVLNYQQAVSKYQGCQLIVQQGGDHSFIDFPKMLPMISQFWQLT